MTMDMNVAGGRSATCLDPYLSSFEARLVEKNYKLATIKTYRVLVRRLASLMDAAGVAPNDLTMDMAAQLVIDEERNRREPNKCQNIARRFVEHLIDLGVVPAPVPTAQQITRQRLRADYEDYLVGQRGLSQRTIFHAWRFADRFLDHRFGTGDVDLAAIGPGDVVAFLQHLLGRKAPYRDKTPATHLRTFFQYLFKSGAMETNLALCVPKVAQRWDARLPRYLSPDQIETLLAWVRCHPKHGPRDYAMFLIMVSNGTQSGPPIGVQKGPLDCGWVDLSR